MNTRDLSIYCCIVDAVCKTFNISHGDLAGRSRTPMIAVPRMMAMVLVKNRTQFTLEEIGTAFHRNHATVLHAMKHLPGKLSHDQRLADALSAVERLVDRKTAAVEVVMQYVNQTAQAPREQAAA